MDSPIHGNASYRAFCRIFTVAYDRLFQVRLGDCPAGLSNWPPAGARNKKKATMKIRRNLP